MDEQRLLRALRNRDESAFSTLLDLYYPAMLRLAMVYVGSRARAEEVVQETWLGVLAGLDRFEGRSSLKTWIFRILVNRARTYATREARTVPFSSLRSHDGLSLDGEIVADRNSAGGAARPPAFAAAQDEAQNPDDWILSEELREKIERAIQTLPSRQREVITLRDVEGWTADEVCNALDISETNQRVLLHRARVKVRDALAQYLSEEDDQTDAQLLGV